MPPKAKFTKDEIIEKCLEIVKESGFESLTARNLAAKLGSSPRPIFTLFNSMDEVIKETYKAIENLYNSYVQEGLKKDIAFKGTGEAYILFAINEPKLFQILFMSESKNELTIDNVLPTIDKDYQAEIELIKRDYQIEEKDARDLYLHLWIYSHGIATLAATKVCNFKDEDISKLLTEVFIGQITKIKTKDRKGITL